MTFWNTYFKVAEPAQPDDVTQSLWNDKATIKAYYAHDDKYQAAVMEQYQLYVEMADPIFIRRGLESTFFVTLNSAVLTLVAAGSRVQIGRVRHVVPALNFRPAPVLEATQSQTKTGHRAADTGTGTLLVLSVLR